MSMVVSTKKNFVFLAFLKPSRQLLEFYRRRFAQQDREHDSLVSRLSEYKQHVDEQMQQEWCMRDREDEISQLQKSLGDIQISIFEEREQHLRLFAENDRCKV